VICTGENAEANDQFMAALNYEELRNHRISTKESQRCMVLEKDENAPSAATRIKNEARTRRFTC